MTLTLFFFFSFVIGEKELSEFVCGFYFLCMCACEKKGNRERKIEKGESINEVESRGIVLS